MNTKRTTLLFAALVAAFVAMATVSGGDDSANPIRDRPPAHVGHPGPAYDDLSARPAWTGWVPAGS